MPIIELDATIHKIAVDHEGESRVTFTIPLSDLPQLTAILDAIQKGVRLTVRFE